MSHNFLAGDSIVRHIDCFVMILYHHDYFFEIGSSFFRGVSFSKSSLDVGTFSDIGISIVIYLYRDIEVRDHEYDDMVNT